MAEISDPLQDVSTGFHAGFDQDLGLETMKSRVATVAVVACLVGGTPQSHSQDWGVLKTSTGPLPWIYKVKPVMPQVAIDHKIEGYVEVAFTIATDSTVRDAKVHHAEPAGIFEEAALAAVRYWIYEPVTRNGVPVEQVYLVGLRFKLPET
jgi:TonB family protein